MADRRQIKAETIAQSPNGDPHIAAQKRQLAEVLAATAAEAEQRALQAEQQMPEWNGATITEPGGGAICGVAETDTEGCVVATWQVRQPLP